MQVHDELVESAKQAINLMEDMAKVEGYIAESYKSRSFVELLQNADDAEATYARWVLRDGMLFVLNNGRRFSSDDLVSLCRSGQSNKRRDGKTIGYRGIGFKSVASFATRVHVLSGEMSFSFDKELTRAALGTSRDVPLIRVPHPFSPRTNAVIKEAEPWIAMDNVTTVFIFEGIDSMSIEQELSQFQPETLLFLNHIQHVIFDVDNRCRDIRCVRQGEADQQVIVESELGLQHWRVMRSEEGSNSVGILLDKSGTPTSLPIDKAVVYSFIPTNEQTGFPFVINGDFSTDPSRTRIDLDNYTVECTRGTVNLITNILQGIFERREFDKWAGFLRMLAQNDDPIDVFRSDSFKSRFRRMISEHLSSSKWVLVGTEYVSPDEVWISPEWLNADDFGHLAAVSGRRVIAHEVPEVDQILKRFGAKKATVAEVLELCRQVHVSQQGALSILAEAVRHFRFSFTSDAKRLVGQAQLAFDDNGNRTNVDVLRIDSQPYGNFLSELKSTISDHSEFTWFLKSLGITLVGSGDPGTSTNNTNVELPSNSESDDEQLDSRIVETDIITGGNEPTEAYAHTQALSSWQSITNSYSSTEPVKNRGVKKWRTVEQNVLDVIRQNGEIANDVSQRNLGYDIEVRLPNGSTEYVEVKSVNELGLPFSLTTNEFSTAQQNASRYVLALVEQSDEEFSVVFVRDPINSLEFMPLRHSKWVEHSDTEFAAGHGRHF